ncbi:hypothetical protein C8R44DRAFT_326414 [Mycena epipterygia]|nr:hypothetical protein C8R44DRAFT_326414 [Mycena epipterygia]
MSDQPAPFQDAPAPFSGAQNGLGPHRPADFILRSSDGVDFHVHKDILKFVSDFFDTMFSFPQASDDPNELRRDGKPILVIPEARAVLHGLLCLAYPAQTTHGGANDLKDFDVIVGVLEAAHKYQFIAVERLMEVRLENPVLLDAHPHRIFAIARLRKLPELARKAALSTLKYPVCPAVSFPEMEILPWVDGHKLYAFHLACASTAQELAQENAYSARMLSESIPTCEPRTRDVYAWWSVPALASLPLHSTECGPREVVTNHGPGGYSCTAAVDLPHLAPAQWFQNYIERLTTALRMLPTSRTVQAETPKIRPAERAIIDACPLCLQSADNDLARFSRQLAAEIDESNRKLLKDFF